MEATLITLMCSNLDQSKLSMICILLYFLANILPYHCQILQDMPVQLATGNEVVAWSYHGMTGPSSWPRTYPVQCGKFKQSPVDLRTIDAIPASIPRLRLYGYDTSSLVMDAVNDGYVLKFGVKANEHKLTRYRLLKQPRSDMYVVQQIHLHWGNTAYPGSEHFIDGTQYPAEIHFVHKLDKRTLDEALQTPRGLLVLGVMIVVGQHDNPFYEPLIKAAASVQHKNQSFQFSYNIPFRKLLPPNINQFFRYEGSLTTPSCNEVVLWTVFKNPIWISERQMNVLKSLKRTQLGETPLPMVNNFRPLQNLNGRSVFRVGF